jgi:hypothetical protein
MENRNYTVEQSGASKAGVPFGARVVIARNQSWAKRPELEISLLRLPKTVFSTLGKSVYKLSFSKLHFNQDGIKRRGVA